MSRFQTNDYEKVGAFVVDEVEGAWWLRPVLRKVLEVQDAAVRRFTESEAAEPGPSEA
jgi:hypothetical protein